MIAQLILIGEYYFIIGLVISLLFLCKDLIFRDKPGTPFEVALATAFWPFFLFHIVRGLSR